MKGTGPCNFSTIVPFGGHDFCVIDSIGFTLKSEPISSDKGNQTNFERTLKE